MLTNDRKKNILFQVFDKKTPKARLVKFLIVRSPDCKRRDDYNSKHYAQS